MPTEIVAHHIARTQGKIEYCPDEIARQLWVSLAESLEEMGLALACVSELATSWTVVPAEHMTAMATFGLFLRHRRRKRTALHKYLKATPTTMKRIGRL